MSPNFGNLKISITMYMYTFVVIWELIFKVDDKLEPLATMKDEYLATSHSFYDSKSSLTSFYMFIVNIKWKDIMWIWIVKSNIVTFSNGYEGMKWCVGF